MSHLEEIIKKYTIQAEDLPPEKELYSDPEYQRLEKLSKEDANFPDYGGKFFIKFKENYALARKYKSSISSRIFFKKNIILNHNDFSNGISLSEIIIYSSFFNLGWLFASEMVEEDSYSNIYYYLRNVNKTVSGIFDFREFLKKSYIDYLNQDELIIIESPKLGIDGLLLNTKIKLRCCKIVDMTISRTRKSSIVVTTEEKSSKKIEKYDISPANTYTHFIFFSENHYKDWVSRGLKLYEKDITSRIEHEKLIIDEKLMDIEKSKSTIRNLEDELLISEEKFKYIFDI